MSISDMIVVMKLGVVQQIGAPQNVYDDPANLFVAKFLGTPPINVFEGHVKDGMLYLGGKVETEETYEETVVPEVAEGEVATPVIETKTRTVTTYEGGQAVLSVPGVKDGPVTIGIRPEGFVVDPEGPMVCNLQNVEVMGRDVSVVTTHEASLNPTVRSIVDADNSIPFGAETISYSLKRHKVHLFDAETEERLYFEV